MWLKFVVRMFIPAVFDALTAVLTELAKETETEIDDQFVMTLVKTRQEVIDRILKAL